MQVSLGWEGRAVLQYLLVSGQAKLMNEQLGPAKLEHYGP